jgi:hypothetical protein
MHRKNLALGIVTVALSIASTQTAQAATFDLSFSADNFMGFAGTTPPDSSVSGTFSYDALDINSPITSLNSVNLTIDGYSYALGEIAFFNTFFGSIISGSISSFGVSGLTNDFSISFDPTNLSPGNISYTTSGINDIFSGNFTSFNITPAAATSVPEPFTIIGSLIGGTAAVRMRKKLSNSSKV